MLYPTDSMTDETPVNSSMQRRFTVHQAAQVLGITPEAVRGRIQRGTLPKEKDADGSVYVRLTDDASRLAADGTGDATRSTVDESSDESALVQELKDRVEHLTRIIETRDEEIRRRDTILMSLTQRIPELEAPHTPRESPETGSDLKPGVDPQGDDAGPETGISRPWWRRLLGG